MRQIIVFLIVILLNINITAQDDSVAEALKYYPLHIGDFWQYKITCSQFEDSSWIGFKEVVGDTIMPNGKSYFVVNEDRLPFVFNSYILFFRVDSTTANIYQYDLLDGDLLIDSLLAKENDMIDNCYIFAHDSIKELFGAQLRTRLIKQYCIVTTAYNGWELAQGLGEIMRYYDDVNIYLIHYQCDLIYARISNKEYGTQVSVLSDEYSPRSFSLSQNYPNPFNPATAISYQLPVISKVQLKVYDLLGREIATLVNEAKPAGNYEVTFDASNLSSGVYFYQLKAGDFIQTRKMILLR